MRCFSAPARPLPPPNYNTHIYIHVGVSLARTTRTSLSPSRRHLYIYRYTFQPVSCRAFQSQVYNAFSSERTITRHRREIRKCRRRTGFYGNPHGCSEIFRSTPRLSRPARTAQEYNNPVHVYYLCTVRSEASICRWFIYTSDATRLALAAGAGDERLPLRYHSPSPASLSLFIISLFLASWQPARRVVCIAYSHGALLVLDRD